MATHAETAPDPDSSFLARNEFLIRRLHSLSGLIPVGAYMVVHLASNASIMDGAETFQRTVFGIHSLGSLLPMVEWVFIFIPILFHAIVGVMIVAGAVPNSGKYPYVKNYRYVAQRATGMIAFLFIMWHVFHMHGWFHFEAWTKNVAEPLGGYQFRPYNAASTLGAAMQSSVAILIWILYLVGMLPCVFHFANGIWTMGITWGVWITPKAQQRASNVCAAFGVVLAFVGVTAIYGAATVEVDDDLIRDEVRMYEANVEIGAIKPNEHKRSKEGIALSEAMQDASGASPEDSDDALPEEESGEQPEDPPAADDSVSPNEVP